MKINKPIGAAQVNPYIQKKYTSAEKQTSGLKRDQLQISAEAKSMLEENQAISKADQEKVNTLKAEIQNETYQVDSRKVADRLYEFWFKN